MSTLANKAYSHLKQKLISGAYEPGTRLRYGPVGAEIGVSATPVREAIGKLVSEGLVELVPNLGAVVRSPQAEDLAQLYELREGLECFAVELAARRITKKTLAELTRYTRRMAELAEELRDSGEEAMTQQQVQAFNGADLAFHMLIVEAARNRYIEKTLSEMHLLSRVFESQRLRLFTVAVAARAYGYHRRILRGLQAGDGERAARWMRAHIRCGAQRTLEALAESRRPRWWTEIVVGSNPMSNRETSPR